MNTNMNEKGRQTKLLAAVAVLAMVVCAFAVVMPAGVDGESISVDSTSELTNALASASAGDVIDIAAGTYGNDDSTAGYTVYTVDKAVSITSSATTKPVIYGSFWVVAEGVTISNLSINPYGNITGDTNSTHKNGITFYGDKITVTNCDFTVRDAANAFANGISIFPETDNAAEWTITGNTFNGFFKDSADGNWTTTAISIANEYNTGRFGSTINTGDAGLTDDELIAIVNANTFNNNAYAVTYSNYNDTIATVSGATYILDDGFRCAENYNTYILSGYTVDKGTDSTLNVVGNLYVYGILTAGTINNTGIIYDDGTISGEISGSGSVIRVTSSGEATTTIDGTVSADDISALFSAGATQVTVTNGTVSVPENFEGILVIGEGAGLSNNTAENPIVIGENSVLQIPAFGSNNLSFYFSNSTDDNAPSVVLQSFSGQDVTISYGSIIVGGTDISGTISVGADMELELTNAEVVSDDTSNLTVNLGSRSTLTMNDNVVVPSGATMNINMASGSSADDTATANLSRNMTLSVDGTVSLGQGVTMDISDGALTGSGKISVATGATLVYTAGTIGNVQIEAVEGATVTIENGFGIENTIRTDITLEGTDNYLANNITIEEGVTLTIGRNAALDLRGFDLTIRGTLIIERNSTIYSSVNGGALVLTNTGAIQNNSGIIGSEYPITIANGEKTTGTAVTPSYDQTVTMQGVAGVSIQLVRSGSGESRTYDMYVSGDVSRISGVDVHTLTLKNVGINADMTIGSGVVFTIDGETVVSRDVTFIHDGTFMTINSGNGKSFVLSNGSSAVINSPINGTITVNTGVVTTGNQEPAVETKFNLGGTKSTTTPYTYSGITGITISADRVTYPNTQVPGESIVEQRAYVSGTLDFENSSTADGASTNASALFIGTVYVIDNLTIPEDVGITGNVIVSEAGTVVVYEPDNNSVTRNITYTGASYILEITMNSSTVETTYYTNFAAAMGQITSAQDYNVTVSGTFEISGTYELTGSQSIDYAQGARVTIADDGQITVGTDADVDDLAFWEIQGRVIVTEGIGYRPSATYQGAADQYIYAVKTVDSETNTTTYSGFKIAIDNAVAGETITVVGNAEYDGNLIIPAQVTVDVDPEITLTVFGNVTVEAQGTLILDNGASLMVGKSGNKDYTVTVDGTIDATDGGDIGKNATTGDVDLYSTGTVTLEPTAALEGIDVNAAYYTDDYLVYTSVANAIAYAEENSLTDVYAVGTFTESGAIESDGVNIVITNNADVTLGDLSLNGASIYSATVPVEATAGTVMGVYTASVSGPVGNGDAAVNGTVAVSKSTATITNVETLNAEGVNEYRMTIDKVDTSTVVSAGTIEFVGIASNSEIDTDRDLTLTVNAGATLLIAEDASISGEYIVNNGTISVDDGATLTIAAVVPGNVSVLEGGEMIVSATATFTGNVTVDADGAFTVNGILYIGEAPELLGQTTSGMIAGDVDLGDSAIVYVYSGGDVSGATFQNAGAKVYSTAYSINDIAVVTVYTFDRIGIDTVAIDGIVYGLKDLDTGADTIVTTDDLDIIWYAGETAITTQIVGQYDAVSTEIRYNTVGVVISVPNQVTLSIDSVIVNGNQQLAIGTHTVSAVIDPGYSGEITITFNGQTVSNGGTIEITSEMLTQLDAPVLSVSGTLTQDSTTVVTGGSDEMGLTDYLLIILVILIVVMAIMVALRLMRS